ncbi:DUF4426 domain-containing protein [Shewanella sp. C32]|uniref:DUF4426 domain-containing protein n=1 Tax=Shewanella electrica TaxID=515560 RepID=A0ABT2FFP7_9GAMM|nr:DUF4426 domain-containing protein [Shewanella electrica]MCH1925183.1 DUF4426 domain-containing protein [Shewanella electrica]MCS4555008.1 DUF4426 domain-containing protein [Shewanella electrica]
MIRSCITLLLMCSVWAFAAHAEQKLHVDHYDIHYMALPSTFIAPTVAQTYGIQRSRYLALVNIVVIDTDATSPSYVPVEINGIATNLLEARFKLKFREIREGHTIYYLAQLPYRESEEINFDLSIKSQGKLNTKLNFTQQFFND